MLNAIPKKEAPMLSPRSCSMSVWLIASSTMQLPMWTKTVGLARHLASQPEQSALAAVVEQARQTGRTHLDLAVCSTRSV